MLLLPAMAFPALPPTATVFLVLSVLMAASSYYFTKPRGNYKSSEKIRDDNSASQPPRATPSPLSVSLAEALPSAVILPRDLDAYKQAASAHWSQQEASAAPDCVVQPHNVQDLAEAVKTIKREYDRCKTSDTKGGDVPPQFAVRSGGHSPVAGAASTKGGTLIDLSLFKEVSLAEDKTSVVVGSGCRWLDVSKVLDREGLAVVGGRNSCVGVGGLTLGGGLSFFSPEYGLVCNNVISYEVVLASGDIVTASAASHPDLWRALKGGSNNFGVVTSFTFRCFPVPRIWSGFVYLPGFQATKVLAAFHEEVNKASPGIKPRPMPDPHAAGPMTCFTWLNQLGGFHIVSVNLVYTKSPSNQSVTTKGWPDYWHSSSLRTLSRYWHTMKWQSPSSAYDEMHGLSPYGRRQTWATTTVKNDPETMTFIHSAWKAATAGLKKRNVKDMSWTLVLQPMLPSWARKGDPAPLGLDTGDDEPLVTIELTNNWSRAEDDEYVEDVTKSVIEDIDAFAKTRGTWHRYRYLNYCAKWQRPFEGYGEENLHYLRQVSQTYDPDQLFQRSCSGGFKLFHGDDVI